MICDRNVRLPLNQTLLVAAFLLMAPFSALAGLPIDEAAKSLPDTIDSFHAQGPAQLPKGPIFAHLRPEEFDAQSYASRAYINDAGASFVINLIRTENDSGAYALLTRLRSGNEEMKLGVVGSASIISPDWVAFCKGDNFVQVRSAQSSSANDQLLAVARSFAATLPDAENDIPVLVKHLPNWQMMAARTLYAVRLEGLKSAVPDQPSLDAMSFEGGTEAVAANYAQSQLVIVEFTTPQFAGDNDRRITARIQDLKSQGQSVPTVYRRVGNYSVFVFNAPDETTANQLIDQVKYEQVVQWLGDDPLLFERLQRYYAQTSAGVLVAVLETSGLSLVLCLFIGGLLGAILFRHRRAQQRQAAVYSDAGGMVRLNLDEMSGRSDPRRLLEPGKQSESAGT